MVDTSLFKVKVLSQLLGLPWEGEEGEGEEEEEGEEGEVWEVKIE